MRASRRGLLAAAVALTAIAAGSPGGDASTACGGQPCQAALRLPAAVTITAQKESFRIGRDGRIRRLRVAVSPLSRRAIFFADGGWFIIQHRHLVVGRGNRRLWRSNGLFPREFSVGVIRVAAGRVAFSYRRGGAETLYVARIGSTERAVAAGEFPLLWTRGGLYTYRYHGRQLLLRSDSGALERTLVSGPLADAYDERSGSLYFITHGSLILARAAAVHPIASIAHLGFITRQLQLQPVGDLLELADSSHLVLLRADGSLFGETQLPRGSGGVGSISSSLAVGRGGHAVAYTVAVGRAANARSGSGGTGSERVYVLRAGGHAARQVFRERVSFAVCERGADVQWHGRWVLYSATEGKLALIDTSGSHRPIDLSGVAARLAGHKRSFSAYWSDRPPGV